MNSIYKLSYFLEDCSQFKELLDRFGVSNDEMRHMRKFSVRVFQVCMGNDFTPSMLSLEGGAQAKKFKERDEDSSPSFVSKTENKRRRQEMVESEEEEEEDEEEQEEEEEEHKRKRKNGGSDEDEALSDSSERDEEERRYRRKQEKRKNSKRTDKKRMRRMEDSDKELEGNNKSEKKKKEKNGRLMENSEMPMEWAFFSKLNKNSGEDQLRKDQYTHAKHAVKDFATFKKLDSVKNDERVKRETDLKSKNMRIQKMYEAENKRILYAAKSMGYIPNFDTFLDMNKTLLADVKKSPQKLWKEYKTCWGKIMGWENLRTKSRFFEEGEDGKGKSKRAEKANKRDSNESEACCEADDQDAETDEEMNESEDNHDDEGEVDQESVVCASGEKTKKTSKMADASESESEAEITAKKHNEGKKGECSGNEALKSNNNHDKEDDAEVCQTINQTIETNLLFY